jgi:hypothetical protein
VLPYAAVLPIYAPLGTDPTVVLLVFVRLIRNNDDCDLDERCRLEADKNCGNSDPLDALPEYDWTLFVRECLDGLGSMNKDAFVTVCNLLPAIKVV